MSAGRYTVPMPWDTSDPRPREPIVQRGMDLVGDAVRRRRERLHWSQRELGRRTGIDQSSISRLENGHRCGLRWSRFVTLVAVLGGLDFPPDGMPRPRPVKPPSWRTIRSRIRAEEEIAYQRALVAIRAARDTDEDDDADDDITLDDPPTPPPAPG